MVLHLGNTRRWAIWQMFEVGESWEVVRTLTIITLGLLIVGCGKQERIGDTYQRKAEDAHWDTGQLRDSLNNYQNAFNEYDEANKYQ